MKGWSPSWQGVNFVNFGRGNAGAPGGYVYLIDYSSTAVKLTRFSADKWSVSSAYQIIAGIVRKKYGSICAATHQR